MIAEVHTYVVACDVCGGKSERFESTASLPAPFVTEKRWNRSWSALIDRHYCGSDCSKQEAHGLERAGV